MRVVLPDYGAGNLRSVCAALVRAGAEPSISEDPVEVREAPLALVAGVGAVAAAAAGLRRNGLDEALRERVSAGRPVFGICVGMQLLFGASEEGGSGLGLLDGSVVRLQARQVPHMGWNTLGVAGGMLGELDGEDVYFAHSFAPEASAAAVTATVDHDGPVAAAAEAGAVAGVQFHPERSGPTGARVLREVLAWSSAA